MPPMGFHVRVYILWVEGVREHPIHKAHPSLDFYL